MGITFAQAGARRSSSSTLGARQVRSLFRNKVTGWLWKRTLRHFAKVVILGALGSFASPWTPAMATSNRCAHDEIPPSSAIQADQRNRISDIWKQLHGPGLDGGDGPLGCPIGAALANDGPGFEHFPGVRQQFQRGWIYLGHGGAANGYELAIVRGLRVWTVWANGLSGVVTDSKDQKPPSSATTPGGPWFGGTVTNFPSSDQLTLWRCDVPASTSSALSNCEQLIPAVPVADHPFDFAAHLKTDLLAAPDRNARALRTAAALSDWLACFTRMPGVDGDAGEDTVVFASVMLRRNTPCPLTNTTPRDAINAWLATFTLPAAELPGTTLGAQSFWLGQVCAERKGELDVLLVQLVALRYKFQSVLNVHALSQLDSAIAPWGGAPRSSPYIEPQGSCLGRAIIETENHLLLQETARYFVNAIGSQPNTANRDWLLKFLQQIARRDFYEFNALPYTRYQTKALFALSDYAPDDAVRTAARGILDWSFAKLALSDNLDRDHRPYRRRIDSSILADKAWWSSAMNATTVGASIFVGPVQHANGDLDLQLNRAAGDKALLDLATYPQLGTASEFFAAALLDAANTSYVMPPTLLDWFERRFTDDDANRLTYIQGIHHHSPLADDPALFLQANAGNEIVSGNRNWTMIGGGTFVRPGYLPTPPSGDNGVITSLSDVQADKTQLKGLWEDQPGVLRETILIPTAVGISRQQTVRFGGTEVSARNGNEQESRLCVTEGFMCGFDLRLPEHPFPSTDGKNCPVLDAIPPELTTAFQKYAGTTQPITTVLGCLVKHPGYFAYAAWQTWTFEHGMLALPVSRIPDAFEGAWIEGRDQDNAGHLRVVWNSSWEADWFRVHAYDREVTATGGEPPGGWLDPLPIAGNPDDRTKDNKGNVNFDLSGIHSNTTWELLIVGCQRKYFIVGTGHDCTDNSLPKLTVTVSRDPIQPFSCKVDQQPPPDPRLMTRRSEGVVLEVGSCTGGPYGMYVYYWTAACPRESLASMFDQSKMCPLGSTDYGFVAVAPSRGWLAEEFRSTIDASIAKWRAKGNGYLLGLPATIDVPMSPPVVRTTGGWQHTGSSSLHTVTFQWSPLSGAAAVLDDTGAPGLFAAGALGTDPQQWPTARGHVSAPDVATASAALLTSSGTGCFTMAGVPTATNPDPPGLLVDLRNTSSPVIATKRTSDLAQGCH